MKRSIFLKSMFTLITVPTLTGGLIQLNPFEESDLPIKNATDYIRFYGNIDSLRIRDVIISDMGDKALVIRIINIGDAYVEARPMVTGQYKYMDINKVACMGRCFTG